MRREGRGDLGRGRPEGEKAPAGGASRLGRLRATLARLGDPFPSDPRPLLAAVSPSVLSLDPVNEIVGRTQSDPPWGDPERPGCGSGVAVWPRGVVLTASRLAAGEPLLWAKGGGGTAARVRFLGVDREAGLAAYLPAIPLRSSARLELRRIPEVGEPLLIVGRRPTGSIASAVVRVAALHLDVRVAPLAARWNLLELDRPPFPFAEGAPIFDRRGRVVGIAARIPEERAGAFAIVLAPWRPVVRAILRGRRLDAPYLGVSGHNQRIEGSGGCGVLVTAVDRKAAAFAAGIRPFDCIVAIDGEPVDDLGILQERIHTARVGTIIIVELLRGERRLRLPVRLESTRRRARRGGLPP